MSDHYEDHDHHQTHDQHSAEEHTMDHYDENKTTEDQDHQAKIDAYRDAKDRGLTLLEVIERPITSEEAEAFQALWIAAAQEAPTVDDLELARLELQEAEEKVHRQLQEYKLGLIQRARVFGRGTVAEEMQISRKALASWEAELSPEGDDLSGYYEQLKKNQEREQRRAERAAEKAAQEAASLQRLLDRVRTR